MEDRRRKRTKPKLQIGFTDGLLSGDSAFLVCDRIGRIWATRQLCLFWIVGAAIFMGNNGSLGAVYAGRFIAGLGVGQTVVVAPIYLAEIVSSDDSSAHAGRLTISRFRERG